jgi:apolipoprotein N-acyltransferase
VVIDAQGQVSHALTRHTRGTLVAQVKGTDGLTVYARLVSGAGLLPWYGLAALSIALAVWLRRRGAPSRARG